MEIIPVVPRGYCKGVVRAINMARHAAEQYPDKPITMLGMIVHNKYVVNACKALNIQCVEGKKTRLELLDDIDEGVVIFTAHGVSDAVRQKAEAKGLIVMDATCTDVEKTHNIVKKALNEGKCIIYIGKKDHPEAEGVASLSEDIHLISSVDEVKNLSLSKPILITNQTTMSITEIKTIIDACMERYPDAILNDEICNATRIRQEAIMKLEDMDVLFVVGDPHSNNSAKLRDIAISHGIPDVYMIEDHLEIKEEYIKNKERIGITSGASTPTYITEKVISSLRQYAESRTLSSEPIDLSRIL